MSKYVYELWLVDDWGNPFRLLNSIKSDIISDTKLYESDFYMVREIWSRSDAHGIIKWNYGHGWFGTPQLAIKFQ